MKSQTNEKWHGAHHYSGKVHLLFVAFIFFAIFTLLWSYFSIASVSMKVDESNSQAVEITPSAIPTQGPTISPTKSPTPTCRPRPACLEATPHCLIPITEDMCPPKITPTTKPTGQVFCTMEAKLCPDGKTYVGRTGPNCEFTKCP